MAVNTNDVTILTPKEFRIELFDVLGSTKTTEVSKWLHSIQPEGDTRIYRLLEISLKYGMIEHKEIFEQLFTIRSTVENSSEELGNVQFEVFLQWIKALEDVIWSVLIPMWNKHEFHFRFQPYNEKLLYSFYLAMGDKPSEEAFVVWQALIKLIETMNKIKEDPETQTLIDSCKPRIEQG